MEVKISTYSYGKSCWCVKTPLSPDGEIYVHADAVEFKDGCLVLVGSKGVNLAIANGPFMPTGRIGQKPMASSLARSSDFPKT
jgi:hypothetical protein